MPFLKDSGSVLKVNVLVYKVQRSCIGQEEGLCLQRTAVEHWSGQAAFVKYDWNLLETIVLVPKWLGTCKGVG
jgi:hypothetical protein